MAAPLFIATLHRPAITLGGIQQHVRCLRQYCADVGVPTSLVSPFDASPLLVNPLFGIRRLLRGAWEARWYEFSHGRLLLNQLRNRLDRQSPSIIYAQDPVSGMTALSLRKEGWPVQVVLAVHFNDSIADEWAGKGNIQLDDRTYRNLLSRDDAVVRAADRVIFVSRYMRDLVGARVGEVVGQGRFVVHNSAPVPSAAFSSVDGGFDADLISIGSLEPRKNQRFLLQVLAEVHALGFPYTLTLVGSGGMLGQLRREASRLGLSGHVNFAGGIPDAAPMISRHRAYVHAARMESLGIVMIEALAAGRPVFAAPVGGVSEVFDDGVQGRYWSLDQPREAAARLIAALESPATLSQMSVAARERFERRFAPGVTQPALLAAVLGDSKE